MRLRRPARRCRQSVISANPVLPRATRDHAPLATTRHMPPRAAHPTPMLRARPQLFVLDGLVYVRTERAQA